MDIRPWPNETYEMLNQAIIMTKGLLCDPNFEMADHEIVYEAYLRQPNDPMIHLALQISCMGHQLPNELQEYVEAVNEDREDVKPIVDELPENL